MFCAVIVVSTDGEWTPSNGIVYVVFMICTLTHGIIASTLTKIMNKLQTFAVFLVRCPSQPSSHPLLNSASRTSP